MTARLSGSLHHRLGDRWARCLVLLYPAAFRREFGAEMLTVLRDEARGRIRRGAGPAWFWVRTTVITAACALGEHVATLRDRLAAVADADGAAARRRRFEALRRQLASDVRAALDEVERHPWRSVALAVMAAAVSAFAVVALGVARAGLWQPAFPAPDRLVSIETAFLDMRYESFPVSPVEFFALERRTDLFASIGAWTVRTKTVTVAGRPTRARVVVASPGVFTALGLDTPPLPDGSEPHPVYATHGYWGAHGGVEGRVGQRLDVDGVPVRIAGRLPAGFRFWRPDIALWIPYRFTSTPADDASHILGVVARVDEGVSVARARLALEEVGATWSVSHPGRHGPDAIHPFRIRALGERLIAVRAPPFRLLWAGAGGLLLLAVLHLAGIRPGPVGDIGAPGAIRRAFLAAAGAVTGGAVAVLGLLAWSAAGLGSLSYNEPAPGEALAGAAAILLGAMTLTAAVVRFRRGPRGTGPLVALDIAVAVAFLFGAGMLERSSVNLRERDLGYRPSGVVTFEAALPMALADRRAARDRAERVAATAAALPSVTAVALTSSLPLTPELLPSDVYTGEGPGATIPPRRGRAHVHFVSAGYTEVLGMGLVEGRRLTDGPEAVVSATLARRLWPEGHAVGARIAPAGYGGVAEATVVGVVADAAQTSLVDGDVPQLYVSRALIPEAMVGLFNTFMVVARATDPARAIAGMPADLSLDGPPIPTSVPSRLTTPIDAAAAERRFLARLLATGAVLCLILGLVTAGVVLPPPVRWLPRLAPRVGAGLGAGLILALGIRRVLEPLLVGTGLADPVVLAGVVVGLFGWVAAVWGLHRGRAGLAS